MSALIVALAAFPAGVVTRHFGPEEGLAHDHVRDITQDSRGYMWFATWTGVDRFDGYEFRNYRSFPGDSVKLDNNRVERVEEDEQGRMWIMTYTGRVYSIDGATGRFSLATSADSARFIRLSHPKWKVRDELADFEVETPLSFTDRDGNLWLARRTDGIDYVSAAPEAFKFIDSEPLEPIGNDIHNLYAAPDGRLWATSRDKRVMLYDSAGGYVGNLAPDGRVVANPSVSSGLMVYSAFTDSRGRVWLGTKQKELAVLTPAGDGRFALKRYREGERGLRCGDIYAFAEDSAGNLWIGTFGGGVAKVEEGADGEPLFEFPARYPAESAGRVRELVMLDNGLMVGATTRGVVAFDPSAPIDSISFRLHTTDPSRGGALSNNDVLDILPAADGSLYFSAYSGGIDRLASPDELMAESPEFNNRNIRDGLAVDPVLSVTQDAEGGFWVVSHSAIARYDGDWNHIATYNAGNAGRPFRLTEARPQSLPGGRFAFGIGGGLLIIDPAAIASRGVPRFAVTEVEAGGERFTGLPADGVIRLPRGDRDLTARFAALDFAGASNIMYAYRLDDGDWMPLGHERVVRLSSLPSGTTRISLRWTDAYGVWTDEPFEFAIEVPRTWREIAGDCAIVLCAAAAFAAILFAAFREYGRRKRRRALERYIAMALGGGAGEGSHAGADAVAGVMAGVCRVVGERYPDSALRAEDVARGVGVGRGELRRVVKAAAGISIEDFIRAVRVRAASRLLAEGKLNVAETAYRCGFKTPQYMAMLFKEQTGLTPSDYASRRRKKCK
ncbi:MAG: helix-turn-helix domain-containing protein [[Clostridium] fimetarium]|nr:helix-turn-helix domain-containing protein [Alistipes timonensis]MCM1405558.1 helix-turn-helix domain-containing protein [[Clostridium] fimetarium]